MNTRCIFILLPALLFAEHCQSAEALPQLTSLYNCLSALGYGSDSGHEGYVLLPGKDRKALVLTPKAARLVSPSPFATRERVPYIFTLPGSSRKIQVSIDKDGQYWPSVASEEPGPAPDILPDDAVEFSGDAVASASGERADSTESLDAYLRDQPDSDGRGFGLINGQRLLSKVMETKNSLSRLSRCDQVGNQQIKAAAKAERERLQRIEAQLSRYEGELKAYAECVNTKMQSDEASRQREETR